MERFPLLFTLGQRWLRFLLRGRIWTTCALLGRKGWTTSIIRIWGACKDNWVTLLFPVLGNSSPPFPPSPPQKQQQQWFAGTLPWAKQEMGPVFFLHAHRHLLWINTYYGDIQSWTHFLPYFMMQLHWKEMTERGQPESLLPLLLDLC